MKVECVKEKLVKAISSSEKITGKNLTLPVLGCILLEAKDGELTIRATNLDLGIEYKIPVKVVKPGKIAIPGAVLSNFISNLNNTKNITLEVLETGVLSVKTEYSSIAIKPFVADDFPTLPTIVRDKTINVIASDFVKGLRSVVYSASVSSVKPELSSVYVYGEEDMLVFAATDSFRLAEKRIKVKGQHLQGEFLIPHKNISEIIRVLSDVSGSVEIVYSKNQIAFVFDTVYLTSRVIEGVFPDYKQIIPKEGTTDTTALKQDVVQAFKLLTIFSDKFNQVHIKLAPATKLFEISTRNENVGEGTTNIPATVNGESINVNFNHKYVADGFQSIDADSIQFTFNGLNRPLVMRGVNDKTFLYIVMPMNK